ncbi:MAG TPA: VOC family protein [Flavitalea sp.]|nr:VOC family protein [Flavitalea sp.]
MAKVSTYLNFDGNTEEAFNFYKSVFGTDFQGDISRFGDTPPQEGMPPLSDELKNKVMHVALPIIGGHLLMGTDACEEMGFHLTKGNNVYIALHPDSRKEADKLFNALSDGGKVEMPLAEQFWGDYYGSLSDKFGVGWMINTDAKK